MTWCFFLKFISKPEKHKRPIFNLKSFKIKPSSDVILWLLLALVVSRNIITIALNLVEGSDINALYVVLELADLLLKALSAHLFIQ